MYTLTYFRATFCMNLSVTHHLSSLHKYFKLKSTLFIVYSFMYHIIRNIESINHKTQHITILLYLFIYLSTILFTKQSINQSVTMPIPSRRKTKQAKNKTKPLTLPNQHSSPTVQLQTQGSHHSLCHLPFPTSFCCLLLFFCV